MSSFLTRRNSASVGISLETGSNYEFIELMTACNKEASGYEALGCWTGTPSTHTHSTNHQKAFLRLEQHVCFGNDLYVWSFS